MLYIPEGFNGSFSKLTDEYLISLVNENPKLNSLVNENPSSTMAELERLAGTSATVIDKNPDISKYGLTKLAGVSLATISRRLKKLELPRVSSLYRLKIFKKEIYNQ
ncbi:hypothetical protein CONCODRAFT_11734 [Conidiobolus coronatus NRRL 28638]|uniref:Uncharacterized protein n=1 Tax=Conidiobolus coronatus (strain ATCC 28846 / CBS 209.66 / NRRL 28638) TaxID=796925 RepID=A0A137NUK5_CONC2|nr:hypothetical protein CONCODRAFT_11734 [Conidiobolus coronatus NRRL 28638]|eukprot:KXN66427.1 hypothetical protein CONCODRAFT_11734 [Conidiobolus coronatus NRRL 28638]